MSAGKAGPVPQPKTAQGDKNQLQQQQQLPEDFLASPSFTGARDGYFFTTGDKGTGYYKDVKQKITTKAKPAVLKSSSIVKGLQRKTGPASLPDPKKRKTESDTSTKPTYLKEMDKYHAMNCSSNTQHDRPLVK